MNTLVMVLSETVFYTTHYPLLVAWCACLVLSFYLLYVQIPSLYFYYQMNGRVVPFFTYGGNLIEQRVRGRIKVFFFCRRHGFKLHLLRSLLLEIVEFILKLALLPDPYKYVWEGIGCIRYFPLSETRRHWLIGCILVGQWPWLSGRQIDTIMAQNNNRMYWKLQDVLVRFRLGEQTTFQIIIDHLRKNHAWLRTAK